MTTNDRTCRERRALPDLSQLKNLIDQTRSIRLELVRLSSYEVLAEPAKAAVEALSTTGLQLERVTELVIAATTRKRRRRTKTPDQPVLPKLEES